MEKLIYDMKTEQEKINKEVYDKYRKILPLLKITHFGGTTRTRILQNKKTNRLVISTEELDFRRKIAIIEIDDSNSASNFAIEYYENIIRKRIKK